MGLGFSHHMLAAVIEVDSTLRGLHYTLTVSPPFLQSLVELLLCAGREKKQDSIHGVGLLGIILMCF
jgi:hypothetical protein